ncbi:Uncharacterised protein [uncultured archaeon]|nr:Uncharacterised protein [uncultured archaeon]
MQKRFLFILIALAILIPTIAFADVYNENALNCTNLPPLCPQGQSAAIIGQTNSIPPACIWECQLDNNAAPDDLNTPQPELYDENSLGDQELISPNPQDNACDWCSIGSNCYELDYRLNGQYCSINKIFEDQKGLNADCENNPECKSNMCSDSKCIETGLIATIINFFKNLFASMFGISFADSSANINQEDINYQEQNFQTNPPTCGTCADEGNTYLCTFMDGYKICSDSTEESATCIKCDTN